MTRQFSLERYGGSIAFTTPEMFSSVLLSQARAAREILEGVWSPATAYHGIEYQDTDPISRGQCGVSSLWLARQFQRQAAGRPQGGIVVNFVEGRVQAGNLDEELVWVEAGHPDGPTYIVDITSDQYLSASMSPVHIGNYGAKGLGLMWDYQPVTKFPPFNVPRRKLQARLELLEQSLVSYDLPRWLRLVRHVAAAAGVKP